MTDRHQRTDDRHDLPTYSALRTVPSRRPPPDLAAQERSAAFAARREPIERALREPPRRPPPDQPLFTTLWAVREQGVLSFDLPGGAGRCVPVFSTPFRAADYVHTLVTPGLALHYLASSPEQLVHMLRDLEGAGIGKVALDRCPRCDVFTTIDGASLRTADDALTVWAIWKATELARLRLYVEYARAAARAGRLAVARDVALETVGHVCVEAPQPHLLLGQLAVARGDRVLLNEARAFPRYFRFEPWERQLDRAVQSGVPDYKDVE